MSLFAAQELVKLTRLFYKGSLKSSNKRYSCAYGTAPLDRKNRRNINCDKANKALAAMKSPGEIYKILEGCDPQNRFGNCTQYSMIAAKYGLMKKVPNIWIAAHEDRVHVFLVLTQESFQFKSLTIADFSKVGDKAFFICDPWFNVACEVGLYKAMIMTKSSQWAQQGKEIFSNLVPDPEPVLEWVNRLFVGRIWFQQLTDKDGKPTQFYTERFLNF
ncbi:hypothetical protein [Endozoicomonas lisbonensis]|uniref:Transglutaminase-like domain-containing protein n=1 Tax=Endozoicomonas lisbonensis TaxID=3120522 RepID=A0ABV2SIC5_9GAMM